MLKKMDGSQYGDDGRPVGVAQPCDDCGVRPAAGSVDGRDLCEECTDDAAEEGEN